MDKKRFLTLLTRIILWGSGVMGVAILVGWCALWRKGFFTMPDFSLIKRLPVASTIYDAEDNVLGTYCLECRAPIALTTMGDFPKFAVAAEDKDFWTRWTPVSVSGIGRAFVADVKTRSLKEGGSTITQQLARNVFMAEELLREREGKHIRDKLWRKGRELWIAFHLERTMARKEILELYLNTAYCGNNHFGVEACTQYYFGKDAKDASIAEKASIIGSWRSPRLSVKSEHVDDVKSLHSRVLHQLVSEHVISPQEELAALHESFKVFKNIESKTGDHFAEFVRREMTRSGRFVDQGIKVRTSLDPSLQEAASAALYESLRKMKKRNPELEDDLCGAALMVEIKTGAVKVWAEYPEFSEIQYDLLAQTKRHTGSAFKPFFVAAWLKKGGRLTCEDEGTGPCTLDDSFGTAGGKSGISVKMGGGKIHYLQNFPYDGLPRYRGIIPVILAVAESRNVAIMSGVTGVRGSRAPTFFVKGREERISKDEILDVAESLGISRPATDPGLTLPIGSIDVSVYKMVEAWTGFMGNLTEPRAIAAITDREGNPMAISSPVLKEPFTPEESLDLVRAMRAVVEFDHGTARKIKDTLGIEAMGKTGTATDAHGETTDNWFIGCTPSYCMGVWIGRKNKLPMNVTKDAQGKDVQETGGRNALPVWIATIKKAYEHKPVEHFPVLTNPQKPFHYESVSK